MTRSRLVAGVCIAALGLGSLIFTQYVQAEAQETASSGTPIADVPLEAKGPMGPSSLSETYRDWVVRCQQVEVAEANASLQLCQMSQELHQRNGNQRVLAVNISGPTDGGASQVTIITPFGLDISAGIGLRIDDVEVSSMAFTTCLPVGCVANLELDKITLTKLQEGQAAQVVLHQLQSPEPLLITVSLAGFTAAWDRLDALQE